MGRSQEFPNVRIGSQVGEIFVSEAGVYGPPRGISRRWGGGVKHSETFFLILNI